MSECVLIITFTFNDLFLPLRPRLHGGRGGADGAVLQGDLQGLPRGQVPAEHPGSGLLVQEYEASHHQAPHLPGDPAHLVDFLDLLD